LETERRSPTSSNQPPLPKERRIHTPDDCPMVGLKDSDVVANGIELGIRRLLTDEDLMGVFWERGFKELISHASNGASQWIGRRILTGLVLAMVTAGLVWLAKTGGIK